jgi:hypothetical protein
MNSTILSKGSYLDGLKNLLFKPGNLVFPDGNYKKTAADGAKRTTDFFSICQIKSQGETIWGPAAS